MPGFTAAIAMFVDEAFVEFGAQLFVASLSVVVVPVVENKVFKDVFSYVIFTYSTRISVEVSTVDL